MDDIPEEGGFPAQRSTSMGRVVRVVAAGAMLALAVAAGAAWGESQSSAPQFARDKALAAGRQQKLWEGALSKSLAKKIVKQQVAGVTKANHATLKHEAAPAAATVAAPATKAKPVTAKAAAKAPPKAAAAQAPAKVAPKAAPAQFAHKVAKVAPKAVPKVAPPAKLFDAFTSAVHAGVKDKAVPASRSQKLALLNEDPVLRAAQPIKAAVSDAKEAARKHIAAKAAKAAKGSSHVATAAPKFPNKATKAHAPKKGSQQWEREQDASFFDSLGKGHADAEEREIRKIQDSRERRNKLHELFEKKEEEKVHEGDMKARMEQRNAELAAKKYTTTAFQDMDKHLTNIKDDSVTGFKTMEAKELASEVERDHPNESAQQIAARAMRLLGLVMKDRHGDPQVAASVNVSPMGPMGVASQANV